jgi:hypothetical protein
MARSNLTADYSKMLREDARLLREQSRIVVGQAKEVVVHSLQRMRLINARQRKLKLK